LSSREASKMGDESRDYTSLERRVRRVIDHSYDKYGSRTDEMWVEGERSIYLDLDDVYAVDEELAKKLVKNPIDILPVFSDVFTQWVNTRRGAFGEIDKIEIKIRGYSQETSIRRIADERLGTLVLVTGVIVKASNIYKRVEKSHYICEKCGEGFKVKQDLQRKYVEKPAGCPFCDNRRGFKHDPYESVFIKEQKLVVQEKPKDIPPGQMPFGVDTYVRGDMTGNYNPGDRVKIIGILHTQPVSKNNQSYNTFLVANCIEKISAGLETLELSAEDKKRIKELSEASDVHRKIRGSIAPSIYGYPRIKEAIMYQLFGGMPKSMPDTRIRGDINILLVGDPGVGKSQILRYTSRVSPRGILTTGKGSTAAGLTAAAVKEKEGGFSLEAGALVLADKGLVAIDEFEKMRADDRNAIHPAMEQQVVSIAKGGIVAELNARCSVLAAANPTNGRYNPYESLKENLKELPVTLLNRFDLIFIVRDIVDYERDEETIKHMRKMSKMQSVETALDTEMLRKYIAYAKQINPLIPDEVYDLLDGFYHKMRGSNKDQQKPLSITPRQYESLTRLTEASARVSLREKATIEDGKAAIDIMTHFLSTAGIDPETGEIDVDTIEVGISRTMQEKRNKILNAVKTSEKAQSEQIAEKSELYDDLVDSGMSPSDIKKILKQLKRDGLIYEPRPGYYKTT